jgi:hypothetical protein
LASLQIVTASYDPGLSYLAPGAGRPNGAARPRRAGARAENWPGKPGQSRAPKGAMSEAPPHIPGHRLHAPAGIRGASTRMIRKMARPPSDSRAESRSSSEGPPAAWRLGCRPARLRPRARASLPSRPQDRGPLRARADPRARCPRVLRRRPGLPLRLRVPGVRVSRPRLPARGLRVSLRLRLRPRLTAAARRPLQLQVRLRPGLLPRASPGPNGPVPVGRGPGPQSE